MIKSVPFANAAAIVMLGLYFACRILASVAPDFLFSVGQSWFHTFNLESGQAVVPLEMGSLLFGAVSLAVVTWVTAYAFSEIYNRLAKK